MLCMYISEDLSLLQCSSPSAVPNGVVSVYTLPSDVKVSIYAITTVYVT